VPRAGTCVDQRGTLRTPGSPTPLASQKPVLTGRSAWRQLQGGVNLLFLRHGPQSGQGSVWRPHADHHAIVPSLSTVLGGKPSLWGRPGNGGGGGCGLRLQKPIGDRQPVAHHCCAIVWGDPGRWDAGLTLRTWGEGPVNWDHRRGMSVQQHSSCFTPIRCCFFSRYHSRCDSLLQKGSCRS
jgi:hypothetical protein